MWTGVPANKYSQGEERERKKKKIKEMKVVLKHVFHNILANRTNGPWKLQIYLDTGISPVMFTFQVISTPVSQNKHDRHAHARKQHQQEHTNERHSLSFVGRIWCRHH